MFSIGDRVEAIGSVDGLYLAGYTGTIVAIRGDRVGVEFDDSFYEGHALEGLCEYGHGRWTSHPEHDLNIISDQRELDPDNTKELSDFLSEITINEC